MLKQAISLAALFAFASTAVAELSNAGKLAFAAEKKFNFDRQLKAHLKQYFEAIVVPRKFRYLESMPYNSQGKLNKKELESLFD